MIPFVPANPIIPLNINWRFDYYPEAELNETLVSPGFDDSAMICVSLPHTWSTFETTGEIHPFIMNASESDDPYWWNGWGIYRKHFFINTELTDKKLFIEFDGVQKYCRLWFNGHFAGEHKGGYNSFYCDLSSFAVPGNNVLSAAVSNRRNDPFGGIPPKSAGNFNVYGGIYRDVRLVLKKKIYIPFQGSHLHEGGTHIITENTETGCALVNIKTYIMNETDSSLSCRVTQQILDLAGIFVADDSQEITLNAGSMNCAAQSIAVNNPLLWSPDEPNMYKVRTTIEHDGQLLDNYESPLGFRWFSWNYDDNRLYLNGKKTLIHGTNRHQEYPWLGDAIPKWMHEHDLKDIRINLGHNFIRTCHYTQDKYVYDLCDRYGILCCQEVPNIKHQEFGADIQRQQVIEMIRRDRNHPSIIMWSMGNETNSPARQEWALDEDMTRIIHFRHTQGEGLTAKHTHKQLQMENLLQCTIRGWYNNDIKALEPVNGQHTGNEKHQHDTALKPKNVFENDTELTVERRLEMNGVMWLYADHGADREYKDCPLLHVNPKGWVDSARVPKLMYYLWQAHYARTDVLYIHPYNWSYRYLHQKRDITINSNCDYVKLYSGTALIGEAACTGDKTFIFHDVLVEDTELLATGIYNGREVSRKLPMTFKPAALMVSASHNCLTANRADISVITAWFIDKNGNTVTGSFLPIQWEIEGPATFAGPAFYETDKDKHEEQTGTMYIDAPVCVPVRAGFEPGTVTVIVSSPGLQPDTILIDVTALPLNNTETIDPQTAGSCNPLRIKRRQYDYIPDEYDESYPQLSDVRDDLVSNDTDREKLTEYVDRFIRSKRILKGTMDYSIGTYQVFKDVIVNHMLSNQGIMVADDYNFLVSFFNQCNRLWHYIGISKIPDETSRQLKQDYAKRIIENGEVVNFSKEILYISQARRIT